MNTGQLGWGRVTVICALACGHWLPGLERKIVYEPAGVFERATVACVELTIVAGRETGVCCPVPKENVSPARKFVPKSVTLTMPAVAGKAVGEAEASVGQACCAGAMVSVSELD